MAEFSALKREIADQEVAIGRSLTFAITVSGVVLAWVSANHSSSTPMTLALWMPFGVSFLFGINSWAMYDHIVAKGKYLRQLELQFGLKALGWERAFREAAPMIRRLVYLPWAALIAATGGIAGYITLQGSDWAMANQTHDRRAQTICDCHSQDHQRADSDSKPEQ